MMKMNYQRIINVLLVLFVLFWKSSVTVGKTFKIAFLAPGRTSNYPINSDNSVDGINLALRSISKNPNILNGHKIAVKFFDTKCNAQSAVTAAMMAKRSYDPDVIVGPPCHQGLKMVAQLGTYWNLPILSWHHTGNDFNSAKTYPTLVRMTPPLHLLSKSLVHVLTKNNWSHVSVLYIGQEPWSLLEDPVREDAALAGVEIHGVYKVASSMPLAALKQMYTHIQRVAHAVVMICPFDQVRHFMLTAASVGLTNGSYTFIHLDPQIYTDTDLATKVLSNGGWKRGDPQDEQARKAYESVLHLVIDPTTERAGQRVLNPRSKYTEYSRMAVYESKFTEPVWNLPSGKMPDVYSAYLCDAVVVWSVLVDMLNKLGKDYRDGNLMATYMRRMTAEGATGYIELNNNLDRLGEVYILDMQPNGNFEPIEFLKFNKTDGYTSTTIDRVVPPVKERLMSRPVVGHFSSINHVKSVKHMNKKTFVITKTSSKPLTTTNTTTTTTTTNTTTPPTTSTSTTTTPKAATTKTTKATTTAALTSKAITTQTTASLITTLPPTSTKPPTTSLGTSTLPPTTTVLPTANTTTPLKTTVTPLKASTTAASLEQSIMARLQAIEAAMKLSQQQAIKEAYQPKTTTPQPIVGIVKRKRKVKLDPHLNNFDVRLKKKRKIYAKAQTILDTIRETGDPNVAEFLRLALDRLNAEEELLTLKQQRNLAKKREMNKLRTNNSLLIEALTNPKPTYKQAASAQGTKQLIPSTTPHVAETTIAEVTTTPPATKPTTKLTKPTTVVTASTPKPVKSSTTMPTTLSYYDVTTTQDISPKRKNNGRKPKRRLRQKWLSEVTPPPSTTPIVTTLYPPGAEVDIIMADNMMISSIVNQVASKLMGKVTGEIQTLKQSIKTMQSTIAKNSSKNQGSGRNVVSAPQGHSQKPLLDIKKDINRSLIKEISANVLTKLSGVSWLEQKPSEPKTNQVFQKPQLAAAISQPTDRIKHVYQPPLVQSTLPPPRPMPQTTKKPTTRKPAPPRVLGSWMSGLPSAVSMQLFALEPGSQRKAQQPNAQLNSISISSPNRHNSNDKSPRMSTRNNPMNIRHTSPRYKPVQINQGVTKSYELPVAHADLFKSKIQHVNLPGANNAVPIHKQTNHNNVQSGSVIHQTPGHPVQQPTAHQNNQPVAVNHNPIQPIQNRIQSTQTDAVPQIKDQSFQPHVAYQAQDTPIQNAPAVQTRNQPVQLATNNQAHTQEIQQAPVYQINNQPQQTRNKPIQPATMHQAHNQPIQQAPVYKTQTQPVHQVPVSQSQDQPLQHSPTYQTQSQPMHPAPAPNTPKQPIHQVPAYQQQSQPVHQTPVSQTQTRPLQQAPTYQTQNQPIQSAPALQIPNQPIQQPPAYQTHGQPMQQAVSNQPPHQPIQPAVVHQAPIQHVQPPNLNMDSIIANITNSVLAGVNKQIDSLKNTMTGQGNAAQPQQPQQPPQPPHPPQPPTPPITPEPVFSLRHMFHKTAAPTPIEPSGKTRLTAQTPDDIVNQISDAVIKQLSSGHVNAHVEQTTNPPPPPPRRRRPTTTTTDKPQEHEPEPQKSNGRENTNNGGGNLADSIASKVFGKMNAKLDALSNTVNNIQRNIGQQELEEMPPEMFGRRGHQMGGHEQMMQMPNMPPMGMMPMPYPPQSLRQAFHQGTRSPQSDTVTQPTAPTPAGKDLPTEGGAPAWAPPTMNPWMSGGMSNQGNMWGSPRSSWWA